MEAYLHLVQLWGIYCEIASQGRFLQAGTRFMFQAPILMSEPTALRDGLKAAKDVGFTQIQIEGNNWIVIQAVQGEIHIP